MQDEIFDYHNCLRLARRARRQGDMQASERWAKAAHAHLKNLRLNADIRRDIQDRMEQVISRSPPPPPVYRRKRSMQSLIREMDRDIARARKENPKP
jgi:hypothetical protein